MIPLLLLLGSFFPAPSEPGTVLVRADGELEGTDQVLGWYRVPPAAVPPGADVVPNVHLDLLDLDPGDEPLAGEQWALPALGVERAWRETTGESAVVAVIDSGIQLDHPELAGRVAVNSGEIPDNGIDDDGNGLVDDVMGWDVIDDDNDPSDTSQGHGTEVAGVVAAALNGMGVAGVAPDARILPIRACTNTCEIFSVAWAMEYAVDQGADVINLSLGGFADEPGPLADAVVYAGEAGVPVVAAAGNGSADIDGSTFIPATLPHANLVTATATDRSDSLWSEANYGSETVDLAAPGVDIVTTTLDSLGTYRTVQGTSFAAPHVAATAALMLSVDPGLTPGEVTAMLGRHGVPLPDLDGRTVHGTRVRSDTSTVAAGLTDIEGTYDLDIVWLATEELTRGCNPPDNTLYCPHQPVTRGQIAALLHRALQLPEGPDAFTDDDDTLYQPHIDALAHAGITRGCNPPDNTLYCPHQPVTRGQIAALLHRALRAYPGF